MPPRKKSTRPPRDYDSAFDQAVTANEQAERYQFGDKAQRNYEKAAEMYALAFSFDSSQTDALYDQARVVQTLATIFLPGPGPALAAMRQSIQLYRQALQMDPSSSDVVYNLALALIELAEMDPAVEQASYSEAKVLLEGLAQSQISALHALPQVQDDEEEDDQELDESMTVQEGETVVPSTVIETLLAYSDLLSALAGLDPPNTSTYEAAAFEALLKCKELDAANRYDSKAIQQAEANCVLGFAEETFELARPLNEEQVQAAIQQLQHLHAEDPTDLEILSDLGDGLALVATLRHALQPDSNADQVQDARATFQRLLQGLASPLTNKNTPSHAINCITSSAHRQVALLSLVVRDFSTALASSIQAIESTQTGVYYTPQGTFGKRPGGRSDWASTKALALSALTLVRTHLYAQTDPSSALSLLSKLPCTSADAQRLVAAEFQGDGLWLASNGAEPQQWSNVLASLAP